VNNSEHISDWYRQIDRVSMDDKADYEVMLLDHNNTDDAVAAVTGLMLNLLRGTYREDVLLLLIDGTRGENAPLVQYHALVEVLQMCILYDHQIRHSRDVQEALLDMLETHGERAIDFLHKMYVLNRGVLRQLLSSLLSPNSPYSNQVSDLRSTLIFQLVVVGQRGQSLFED